MMDILACPIDKSHPLVLYTINEKDGVIQEGVLTCTKCSRFYPIIEEIPVLLPDELRDKAQDVQFLKRHKDVLPKKVTTKSTPWHL